MYRVFYLILFIPLAAFSQTGFFKVYPPEEYESFEDLISISNTEYVMLTSARFCRINENGELVAVRKIKEGISSSLESIARDDNGHYWIAGYIFEDLDTQLMVLYETDADGNVLSRKKIDAGSIEDVRIVLMDGGRKMIFCREYTPDGKRIVKARLFDAANEETWSVTAATDLSHWYSVKRSANLTVNIVYNNVSPTDIRVSRIDIDGNLTHTKIDLQTEPAAYDHVMQFTPVAGGGFVFAGETYKGPGALGDALAVRTDATGSVLWKKRFNFFQRDYISDIKPVHDGFIITGTTGLEEWISDFAGDIFVAKLDMDGNLLWRKCFGGQKEDYSGSLIVLNDRIVFGGRASYPGNVVPVPGLAMVSPDGLLPSTFPFTPEPMSVIHELHLNTAHGVSRHVMSAPTANGDVVTGGYFLDKTDDQFRAFVSRNTTSGDLVWYKQLPVTSGKLVILRKIKPDTWLAVTETPDIFGNHFSLYMLDALGNITWETTMSSGYLKDVVPTKDGGWLIVGAEDVSFVDFDVVLIKYDQNGNVQWKKTTGNRRIWETARQVLETPEGHFIMIGNAQKEYEPTSDVYALKIDAAGNKLWEHNLTRGNGTHVGYSVTITPQGEYLFTGVTNDFPLTDKNILLVKMSPGGVIQWKNTIPIHLNDEPYSIINVQGGGFLLSGTTAEPNAGVLEEFSFVMKLDELGRKKWTRYYGERGVQNRLTQLLIMQDTLVVGTRQVQHGEEKPVFVALDPSGPQPDPEEHEIFSIYPNPVQDELYIRMVNNYSGRVHINIIDATGKTVRSRDFVKSGIQATEKIMTTGLAPGVYWVVTFLAGKKVTKRIVVETR